MSTSTLTLCRAVQGRGHHALYVGPEVAAFASQIKQIDVCGVVLERSPRPELDWAVQTLTIRHDPEDGVAIPLNFFAACACRVTCLKVHECLRTTRDIRHVRGLVEAMSSIQFVVVQDSSIENLDALELCRWFKIHTCARAVYLLMKGKGKLAPTIISLDGTPADDLMQLLMHYHGDVM